MSDTLEAITPIESRPIAEHRNITPSFLWHRLALGGVVLISIFMNFYQLGQNGFANLYYAAAIRSMLDNLHNFFYVAFHPAGFVSLDNPPLRFSLPPPTATLSASPPFTTSSPQPLSSL